MLTFPFHAAPAAKCSDSLTCNGPRMRTNLPQQQLNWTELQCVTPTSHVLTWVQHREVVIRFWVKSRGWFNSCLVNKGPFRQESECINIFLNTSIHVNPLVLLGHVFFFFFKNFHRNGNLVMFLALCENTHTHTHTHTAHFEDINLKSGTQL